METNVPKKTKKREEVGRQGKVKGDENKKPKVVEDTCNEQTKNENDNVKDAEKNDRKCKQGRKG